MADEQEQDPKGRSPKPDPPPPILGTTPPVVGKLGIPKTPVGGFANAASRQGAERPRRRLVFPPRSSGGSVTPPPSDDSGSETIQPAGASISVPGAPPPLEINVADDVQPRDEVQIAGTPIPPPPSERPVDAILHDPLGEVGRKERRSLLGLCVIAFLMGFGGLVPTEITNLGLRFTPPERTVLLVVFVAVMLYYIAAFSAYAYSDWLTYWHAVFVRDRELQQPPLPEGVISKTSSEDAAKVWPLLGRIDRAAWFRLSLDFFVPLLAALLALLSLGYGIYHVNRKTTPTETGGYSRIESQGVAVSEGTKKALGL